MEVMLLVAIGILQLAVSVAALIVNIKQQRRPK